MPVVMSKTRSILGSMPRTKNPTIRAETAATIALNNCCFQAIDKSGISANARNIAPKPMTTAVRPDALISVCLFLTSFNWLISVPFPAMRRTNQAIGWDKLIVTSEHCIKAINSPMR